MDCINEKTENFLYNTTRLMEAGDTLYCKEDESGEIYYELTGYANNVLARHFPDREKTFYW